MLVPERYLQGTFRAQQALVHDFFLLYYTTACHEALLPSPGTHELAEQGGNIFHNHPILRRTTLPGRNADAPALQELLAERAVLLRRPSKPAAPSTWRTLSLRGPPRAHLRVRVSLLCSGRAIQHKCWPNSTIHWKRVFHCSLQLIGTYRIILYAFSQENTVC